MEKAISEDFSGYSVKERSLACRLVFCFILISLCYSFYSHTLIHQLQSPVLKFPYVDLTYWIMHLAGIPEFITSHRSVSIAFDALLFICCVQVLLFPEKRVFIGLFIALYFIYFITFNTYGTHHTNSKIGILLMSVPFVVNNTRTFTFLWEGMRYFMLFSYSSAFLWKFFRFSWWPEEQATLTIKQNLTPYLYFNPHTALADLYFWLIQHSVVTDIIFKTGVLLEGIMIIGFFTKKMDKYLLFITILLPFGFLLLADAFFFELLIMSLTLVKLRSDKSI